MSTTAWLCGCSVFPFTFGCVFFRWCRQANRVLDEREVMWPSTLHPRHLKYTQSSFWMILRTVDSPHEIPTGHVLRGFHEAARVLRLVYSVVDTFNNADHLY
ncbi:hypothetical protein PMIN03_001737 [Paraphaeosphaeria minitans]